MLITACLGAASLPAQVSTNTFKVANMRVLQVLRDGAGSLYITGQRNSQDTTNKNWVYVPGHANKAGWCMGDGIFIVRKYDPGTGSMLWERIFSDPGKGAVIRQAQMVNDRLYLAGHFFDSLNVDGAKLYSAGEADIFCVAINQAGSVEVHRTGSTGSEALTGFCMNNSGEVFLMGFVKNEISIAGVSKDVGYGKGFFCCTSEDLNANKWFKTIKSTEDGCYNGYASGPLRHAPGYVYFPGSDGYSCDGIIEETGDTLAPFGLGHTFNYDGTIRSRTPETYNYAKYGNGTHVSEFADVAPSYFLYPDENVLPYWFTPSHIKYVPSPKQASTWSLSASGTHFWSAVQQDNEFFALIWGTKNTLVPSDGYAIIRGYKSNGTVSNVEGLPVTNTLSLLHGKMYNYDPDRLVMTALINGNGNFGNYSYQHNPTQLDFIVSLIQMPNTTEVNEISRAGLQLYPNPCSGKLSVQSLEGAGRLEISDVTGRVVLWTSINRGENTIELPSQMRGVYVVTLEQNGTKEFKKLLVE